MGLYKTGEEMINNIATSMIRHLDNAENVIAKGHTVMEGNRAIKAGYSSTEASKIRAKAAYQGIKEPIVGKIDSRVDRINSAAGKEVIKKGENGYSNWGRAKSLLYDSKDGEFSYLRAGGVGIAGITGVSAAGRIASGGGLYRDSDGEFNIIGIPGI
jgi:hypothetical protein